MTSNPNSEQPPATLLSRLSSLGKLSPLLRLARFHETGHTEIKPVRLEDLRFLAAGISSVVYAIDQESVLKEYHDGVGAGVERRAYQRLSPHPNITNLLGIESNGSIVLERGTPLSCLTRSPDAHKTSLQVKLR
jgi:hypothetical protein